MLNRQRSTTGLHFTVSREPGSREQISSQQSASSLPRRCASRQPLLARRPPDATAPLPLAAWPVPSGHCPLPTRGPRPPGLAPAALPGRRCPLAAWLAARACLAQRQTPPACCPVAAAAGCLATRGLRPREHLAQPLSVPASRADSPPPAADSPPPGRLGLRHGMTGRGRIGDKVCSPGRLFGQSGQTAGG